MAKKQIEKEEPQKVESKTVSMVRDEPQFQGGPVTADVHPDEVENMKLHNWTIKN